MPRKKENSWPFKWTISVKHIRNKLDAEIDFSPGSKSGVYLKADYYNELMTRLPGDFIKFGVPVYRNRYIFCSSNGKVK